MVGSSLTIYAADRHSYQAKAVEMMGETIAAVQTQMQNGVAQSQATVDNSDRDKAARDSAVNTATTNCDALTEKATAAKAAVDDAKTALAAAKVASSSANQAIESNESAIAEQTEQKTKLETTLKDMFEPLKTAKVTGHDGRKSLSVMEKVFTEAGIEAGLVEHVPETLRKDPEARRTFDGLVIKHVSEQAAQCLTKADAALQEASQRTAGLAAAKAQAEADCTAAVEALSSSVEAKTAAVTALKEGQDALKAATSAIVGFEKEMASAAEDLEDAKNTLAAFAEGPLQSFTALRDMAPPPEPEPVPEVSEPVAQEPVEAAVA